MKTTRSAMECPGGGFAGPRVREHVFRKFVFDAVEAGVDQRRSAQARAAAYARRRRLRDLEARHLGSPHVGRSSILVLTLTLLPACGLSLALSLGLPATTNLGDLAIQLISLSPTAAAVFGLLLNSLRAYRQSCLERRFARNSAAG